MKIIEVRALSNGAHRNQTGVFPVIPTGWAVIPDDMEIPASFPFVDVVAEGGVVTELLPGETPEESRAVAEVPSQLDQIEAQVTYTAMMTDTLLEVET